MAKSKKYLPQLFIFVGESILLWAIFKNNSRQISLELLFITFVIVVLGYGIANQCDPKQ